MPRFQFSESSFSNSSSETIFGIDADVLDGISLDKNSTPTGSGLENLSGDDVTEDDQFVLFEFDPGANNEVSATSAGVHCTMKGISESR